MQTHPQEDLVRIEAEQRVSKRARVSYTKTSWDIVSNFTLPDPCDLSTLEIVVTGRTICSHVSLHRETMRDVQFVY
jgi:hypothetical protein